MDKLKVFKKAIEKIFNNQLNDINTTSKLHSFFTVFLGLKYTGVTFIDILNNNLWLCLHNYNTEIRFSKLFFNLITKIFELIVRIKPSADNGMLPIIILDTIIASNSKHLLVSISLLQLIKHCLYSNVAVITPKQCTDIALKYILNSETNVKSKILSFQIMKALIKKGHPILESDKTIIWKLIEELNTIKSGKPGLSYSFNKKQIKKELKLDIWGDTKELDINDVFSYDNKTFKIIIQNEEIIYEYELKLLII